VKKHLLKWHSITRAVGEVSLLITVLPVIRVNLLASGSLPTALQKVLIANSSRKALCIPLASVKGPPPF